MTRITQIPPSEGAAERGAQNVVERYLRVQMGEHARLLTWGAGDVASLVLQALKRAGGIVVPVPLEPLERETSPSQIRFFLDGALEGSGASILVCAQGMPTPLSLAVVEAAARARSRHLHAVSADVRVMGQSMRADPVLLAIINERLAGLLRGSRVRVTSEAGTQLDVTLSPQFPTVKSDGRPGPGRWDNIPSGFVYTYPADVSGTYVVDRSVGGPGGWIDPASLRRNPLRLTFASGRFTGAECGDPQSLATLNTYLASHADAGRVGAVALPTNYLVRSEIGLTVQDWLLPGLSVYLGHTNSGATSAPYDVPVQLRFSGRKQTVEVRGHRVVFAGRLDASLVEGIDPFR